MPASATARALLALPRNANPVGPSFGTGSQVSPLVASYGEWGIAGRQAPALPRPFETFSSGAFGPGTPIWPMPIDTVPEGSEQSLPRRLQYPVFWNLPVGIPGTEGLKLVNFFTLRSYADLVSVVRACVSTRVKEIAGLKWEIVPTRDAERAMRADVSKRTAWMERQKQATEFWRRPDRSADSPYRTFKAFLSALL